MVKAAGLKTELTEDQEKAAQNRGFYNGIDALTFVGKNKFMRPVFKQFEMVADLPIRTEEQQVRYVQILKNKFDPEVLTEDEEIVLKYLMDI